MIRETCSCGATWEQDLGIDRRGVRDWRREHRHESASTEALLDALEDVVNQSCRDGDRLDSQALSAYAHGLRVLAEHGRVKVESEYGRRVIATQVDTDTDAG